VITNAGGPRIIAVDTAERLGIELPHMTKASIDGMVTKLPMNASIFNPIDVIGDATSERYAVVLEQAAKDPNVDGILVILTPQAMTDMEKTAEAVIGTARSTEKPVITSFMGAKRVAAGINLLKAASIPNFSYPELAVKAFKRLADQRAWQDAAVEEVEPCRHNVSAAADAIASILRKGVYQAGEDEAMQVLTHYGFLFPKRALASTSKEAARFASRIGFPVVMKISSPDILHKTDVGGVRMNVADAERGGGRVPGDHVQCAAHHACRLHQGRDDLRNAEGRQGGDPRRDVRPDLRPHDHVRPRRHLRRGVEGTLPSGSCRWAEGRPRHGERDQNRRSPARRSRRAPC